MDFAGPKPVFRPIFSGMVFALYDSAELAAGDPQLMKLTRTLALAVATLALTATTAFATVITPADAVPAVATSPAFGPVAPAGLATVQYRHLGLLFNPGVGIFNDPPLAWGGVNAGGNIDLLSNVAGEFVVPNTSIAAVVGFLSVEGGFSDVGTLLLRA